jgi:hypothetical protein
MRRASSTTARAVASLIAVTALVATACMGDPVQTPQDTPSLDAPKDISAPKLAKQICKRLDPEVLQRTYNGTHPTRSGDLQLIPTYPNYSRGLTHATPYDYTQHVPLLIYGARYVQPGTYPEHVGLVDVAPTTASLLKFNGFQSPDGVPLEQGLLPAADRPIPKLVVTLIWDSAGQDLLKRWPRSWPYLRSIRDQGAWFPNTYLDASPSNTPPSHATIGTGAYPRRHGMVDEYIRIHGELVKPNDKGPTHMNGPTIADAYDKALDNEPVVGGIGTLSAQLMMMSHGSQWPGGDQDIAVAKEPGKADTGGDESAPIWQLNDKMGPFYHFPEYVNDSSITDVFHDALPDADRLDGSLDGTWRGVDTSNVRSGFDTPARIPWQTALIEQVIDKEGFGADDVPDLLFLNYKALDTMGHYYSADGIELSDTLKVQDQALDQLVRFLDEKVGKDEWVMILTADHGMQRDPSRSGAFVIDVAAVQSRIEEAFGNGPGGNVIEKLRPTEAWFDLDALEENGFTLEQVSRFVMTLTQDQTKGVSPDVEPTTEAADDTVFDAAFPSALMDQMPCLPHPYAVSGDNDNSSQNASPAGA